MRIQKGCTIGWCAVLLAGLAGCSRTETVEVVYNQTSKGTMMDAALGDEQIYVRITEGLQVTRLEKMSFPEGSFRTAVLAPLSFAVEGHDVVIDRGEVCIAGAPCGSIGNGATLEISRRGVFLNGKHQCPFPP